MFSNIKSYRLFFSQLFRYSLVGYGANLASYLVYLLMTILGSNPKFTMTVLYLFAATIGFFGNRKFTFSNKAFNVLLVIRYITVYLIGYIINLFSLIIFVDRMGCPHQAVQLFSIFLVAGFHFSFLKVFVFKS
jgi:putative flippase GtrA